MRNDFTPIFISDFIFSTSFIPRKTFGLVRSFLGLKTSTIGLILDKGCLSRWNSFQVSRTIFGLCHSPSTLTPTVRQSLNCRYHWWEIRSVEVGARVDCGGPDWLSTPRPWKMSEFTVGQIIPTVRVSSLNGTYQTMTSDHFPNKLSRISFTVWGRVYYCYNITTMTCYFTLLTGMPDPSDLRLPLSARPRVSPTKRFRSHVGKFLKGNHHTSEPTTPRPPKEFQRIININVPSTPSVIRRDLLTHVWWTFLGNGRKPSEK